MRTPSSLGRSAAGRHPSAAAELGLEGETDGWVGFDGADGMAHEDTASGMRSALEVVLKLRSIGLMARLVPVGATDTAEKAHALSAIGAQIVPALEDRLAPISDW